MSSTQSNTNKLFIVSILSQIYKKLRLIFGRKALIALTILLGFLYKFRAKKHDNIPSVPTFYPIVGNAPFIIKYFNNGFLPKSTEIFLKQGEKKAIFTVSIPTRTQVFVADPKIADLVFREKFSDAIKGDAAFGSLKVLLGDGIFTVNGKRWKKHRSVASHMFTVRSLRDYMFQVFTETTDDLLTKFDEIMDKQNTDIIDFYDMWNRLTFEAFTKIAFGVDVGCISSAPKQAEFGYRFDRCFHLCTNRIFSSIPWKLKRKYRMFGYPGYEYEIDEHSKWLENYVLNIIKERKEYYKQKIQSKSDLERKKLKRGNTENKLTDRYDLLSMFMDDNDQITDKELRDITFSFIIAGKDTTAQMLSWFMYHICTNNLKEIFDKVLEEIKTIFGTNDYDKLDMSYEKVNKCQYIEACLKESLRLYPSVPHLVREAVKDIETPNGYTIRKGDEVMISTYAMGRMPWIWKEPLKFKPERFMDLKNQPDPSVYPAFNIAPRICLGKHVALLEGKIAVIKLFTKYKNIQAVKGLDIGWMPSPTNQMRNGFKAHVKKE